VERRPTRTSRGAILDLARMHGGRTHLGLRRNAPPFAGRCGSRRPQRWCASRSREALHPVRAQRARGSASRSSARTTNGVRGTWIEEGLRPPKRRREPSLDWVRSTRRRLFGGAFARLVSPVRPRKGADEGEGRERKSSLFAERGHEAARGRCPCLVVIAEVGRTPSGSKKRATGSELVESQVEPKEHVNGSLTGDVTRTRKRSGVPPAKGGRSSGERRSSSRERRASEGGYVGSFAFRRGRVARSIYRWKTSRVGKAHAFHEAPAEPVLAASGSRLGAR